MSMTSRRIPTHRPAPEPAMKKYFGLAAILGLIAFVSVSYLAQAQNQIEQNLAAAAESAETQANSGIDALSPEVAKFMQSAEECQGILAAEAEKMDITASEAQHREAFTACMEDRGHTAEEVQTRYFDTEPAMPSATSPVNEN